MKSFHSFIRVVTSDYWCQNILFELVVFVFLFFYKKKSEISDIYLPLIKLALEVLERSWKELVVGGGDSLVHRGIFLKTSFPEIQVLSINVIVGRGLNSISQHMSPHISLYGTTFIKVWPKWPPLFKEFTPSFTPSIYIPTLFIRPPPPPPIPTITHGRVALNSM